MLESLQYRSSNGREIVYADVTSHSLKEWCLRELYRSFMACVNISDGIMNLCGIWQNMDL